MQAAIFVFNSYQQVKIILCSYFALTLILVYLHRCASDDDTDWGHWFARSGSLLLSSHLQPDQNFTGALPAFITSTMYCQCFVNAIHVFSALALPLLQSRPLRPLSCFIQHLSSGALLRHSSTIIINVTINTIITFWSSIKNLIMIMIKFFNPHISWCSASLSRWSTAV